MHYSFAPPPVVLVIGAESAFQRGVTNESVFFISLWGNSS